MRVEDYQNQLRRGTTVVVTDWLDMQAPDIADGRRGIDGDISPKEVYEAYKALAAWLREYRLLHPGEYTSMRLGDPE